jgi:glucoamylase
VAAADPTANVSAAVKAAGDGMINAVVYHSNYFELSERFDHSTGFEQSASNLAWSYPAFLLADWPTGRGGEGQGVAAEGPHQFAHSVGWLAKVALTVPSEVEG